MENITLFYILTEASVELRKRFGSVERTSADATSKTTELVHPEIAERLADRVDSDQNLQVRVSYFNAITV